MPTEWKAWVAIGVSVCIAVLIIMLGLILIARILRGFSGKKGGASFTLGAEHECRQEPLLKRMVIAQDLQMAGSVALLDWAIKQGANGNTATIRDKIAKNAGAFQEFLINKGVEL